VARVAGDAERHVPSVDREPAHVEPGRHSGADEDALQYPGPHAKGATGNTDAILLGLLSYLLTAGWSSGLRSRLRNQRSYVFKSR
jgi:hypothetical protein